MGMYFTTLNKEIAEFCIFFGIFFEQIALDMQKLDGTWLIIRHQHMKNYSKILEYQFSWFMHKAYFLGNF